MNTKIFVTGTDTGVGKTYVSVCLLNVFTQLGYSTLGIKPVASGCFLDQKKLYNEDALALQHASSLKLRYEQINPFAFAQPIAPHIAANQAGCSLTLAEIKQKISPALNTPVDLCLIEGAGGWCVPLNDTEMIADFVIEHQFKVILVVGMRLGCINHALLTAKMIQQSGAAALGWIANCIDPHMSYSHQNIAALRNWMPIPFLGHIDLNGDELHTSDMINGWLT